MFLDKKMGKDMQKNFTEKANKYIKSVSLICLQRNGAQEHMRYTTLYPNPLTEFKKSKNTKFWSTWGAREYLFMLFVGMKFVGVKLQNNFMLFCKCQCLNAL
jgi:hypothetical protein